MRHEKQACNSVDRAQERPSTGRTNSTAIGDKIWHIRPRPLKSLWSQFGSIPPTRSVSQQRGREFIRRRSARTIDVEPPTTSQTMQAQSKARKAWAEMDVGQGITDLKSVAQPVFVANGSNDVMISNPGSFSLYQSLPNAQLILSPDSGHGFLFQYPELFAAHLSLFLNG